MVLAPGKAAAYAANTEKAAPAESWTVTNCYKQAVYDPEESKIGDIDDVLVDKSGKITGLIVGVGGFLGAEKRTSSFLSPPSRRGRRTTSGG
jgi:sporulation protein YlmC with PRC-barrel domain